MGLVERLQETLYSPEKRDNDSVFRELIRAELDAEARVLDAGAGAGELFRYDFKDSVAEMAGIDLDPRVVGNPQLHRGIVCDLGETPFDDKYFDVVFSRYVLEHVSDPASVLAEMYRILKPGGRFLFLTPNKLHYVGIISMLTPQCFHGWINSLRGRDEDDTFPTLYYLNTRSDIRKWFTCEGFEESYIMMRECAPNYLRFMAPAYLAGVAYERLVNRFECLSGLRVNILGCFSKPRKAVTGANPS